MVTTGLSFFLKSALPESFSIQEIPLPFFQLLILGSFFVLCHHLTQRQPTLVPPSKYPEHDQSSRAPLLPPECKLAPFFPWALAGASSWVCRHPHCLTAAIRNLLQQNSDYTSFAPNLPTVVHLTGRKKSNPASAQGASWSTATYPDLAS